MDTAQNRHGKVIHAANAARGERFQCPECKTPVQFVPTGHQTAHFRHLAASGLSISERLRCERCSRYIADRGSHYEPPKARIPVRPQARAALAVGWKRAIGSPERWALYVFAPIPPDCVEQVLIDGNINGEVWLSRLAVAKHRLIPVRAATKQYRMTYRSRADARSSGTVLIVQPTDALDGGLSNVFAAGAGGGQQLGPDEPVVRGRCYFTLSKKPGVWSPPPGETSRALSGSKDCDSSGAWEGHLVYVPSAADPRISAWCQRVLGRSVVAPPADLELVYPPFSESRPDGTLVVSAGEEVILAPRGEWDEPEVEVWRDDDLTASPAVERLSVSSGELIVLRDLPVGLYSVYAIESGRAVVRIEVVNPTECPIPAFTIRTVDRKTGHEFQANLHDPASSLRWAGLLSGSEGWVGISFPDGWPVEFACRLRGESQVRHESVTTPGDLAEVVGKCLAAEPLFASINAGMFGAADWTAPTPARLPAPATKALPQNVRERVHWLLAAVARNAGPKSLPVGIRPLPGWEGRILPEELPAVSTFLAKARWPVALVAHARAVAKDLTDHLRN